jgi:DNA-binding transcriptional MerR regulator
MIVRKGKTYQTVVDAAEELGVSPKTIREWIREGIIDAPPEFEYGRRNMTYFPPEYLRRVKDQIRHYRDKHSASRIRNGKRPNKP